MQELTFEIESNQEIQGVFDKGLNSISIHKFVPNEVIEWWYFDYASTALSTGWTLLGITKVSAKPKINTNSNRNLWL